MRVTRLAVRLDIRQKKGAARRPFLLGLSRSLTVVSPFSMLGKIETLFFFLIFHADADGVIQYHQYHQGDEAGPSHRDADVPQLRDDLRRGIEDGDIVGDVVVDAGAAQRGIDEDTGADRPDDAADAVDTEGVERVVVA